MQHNLSQDPAYASFRRACAFYTPSALRSFFSPDDLERFLRQRFEFFLERTEEIKLRVFNPAPDELLLLNSTIIEAALPDSRFIVDTLVEHCNSREFRIQLMIHPVLSATRDASGRLVETQFADQYENLETLIYIQIARLPDAELAPLAAELGAILAELRRVVHDHGAMLALLDRCDEGRDTAVWLKENFILLGASALDADGAGKTRYGVFHSSRHGAALETEARQGAFDYSESAVGFRETNVASSVNKRRPYFLVLFRTRTGALVFAGHFASRSELAPREQIPPLRGRILELAARFHATPTSYQLKELLSIARSLPAGLLLTRGRLLAAWFDLALANLYTDAVDHIALEDPENDAVWIAAAIPERDAATIPGAALDELITATGAERIYDLRIPIERNQFALIGLRSATIRSPELLKQTNAARDAIFDSWTHRFRRLVQNRYVGEREISARLRRYFDGLAPDYPIHQTPDEALSDLDRLDRMAPESERAVSYYQRANGAELIKIYSPAQCRFSEVVPILSNFGFEILEEYTFPYAGLSGARFCHAFRVANIPALDRTDRERIAGALAEILNGRLASDAGDAMACSDPLSARELALIKALCACYFQMERSYARITIQETLARNASFCKALAEFFHARLAPGARAADANAPGGDAETAQARCAAIAEAMPSLTDESLARNLITLVGAIVRTNYFAGGPAISFKIHSQAVHFAPEPRPLYEIFVYAVDFEGVHLRSDRVARGGIRWSDRPDDFRTETLGLMKAQMVKNTVITPAGSKGGFALKRASFADRQERQRAGVHAYRRFIDCLLELTDNLAPDGSIAPAPGLSRLDQDDPYLVVAADKGTATFSDLANEVSAARNFWLGDAFASGGANGYDHKKQGVTARGAWESVKRFFYELGQDPERDPLTVVGIGDMSGDVFGNGLLLSRSVRLLAAFNHAWIFVDPTPDAEKAFAERARLFAAAANWDEYNPALLSAGGGVYARSSKKIALSTEARAALGVKARSLSGEELIRAILRAPADLLWNGGIGTYVKASTESHFQAHDSANDRVRVDGAELRVRVVAEGGNLGFTQAGRIEAAEAGVRLNTDAIDNSGGVNMSDHEVNLKILLDSLVRKGRIADVAERNRWIRKLEAEEMQLVLATNHDNNLALSLEERRTPRDFVFVRALIRNLNRAGWINRQQDAIPFEADLDRIEAGDRKLPRPVLCALTGFARLMLARELLDANCFQDPECAELLLTYFPASLADAYREEILEHPLRREILVTEGLNYIVNRAGAAYFQKLAMRTFATPARIAETYIRLDFSLGLDRLRRPNFLAALPAEASYAYLSLLEDEIEGMNARLLEHPADLQTLADADPAEFEKLLAEAGACVEFRPARELRAALRKAPEAVRAEALAAFAQIAALDDACALYLRSKRGAGRAETAAYFRGLERLRILKLRAIAAKLRTQTAWEVRFLARIDASLEELGFLALELDANDQNAARTQVLDIVEQIEALADSGGLSAAGFYEMLEQARRAGQPGATY